MTLRLDAAGKRIMQIEKKLERLRCERKSLLTMMHDLGEAFNADLTPSDLLRIVTATAAEVLDASGCAYYRWNPEAKTFSCVSVYKIFPPLHAIPPETQPKMVARIEHLHDILLQEKLPATNQLLSSVIEHGSILIADAGSDHRLPQHKEPLLRFRSLMLCRMSCQGQNYGVLAVANKKDTTPFNRSDLELLQDIALQAAFSLHSAILLNIISEKRKLDQDVNLAGQIQRILLPDTPPVIPGYHLAGENIAAQRLSGDYYDFFCLPEGRVGLVIADVSGKGVAASLIMTMCRAVLRSHAITQSSPAEVLRLVNRQLHPDMQKDMFVTIIYAVLDPLRHTLTLARAGHETPLLWRNGHVETIKSPGMAIGIDSGEMFDLFIQDTTLTLIPGDMLLLYTDGVIEMQNSEQQEFGRDNLRQIICTSADSGARQTIENIITHIGRFRGDAPAYDDITLIALQRDSLPLNSAKKLQTDTQAQLETSCPAS